MLEFRPIPEDGTRLLALEGGEIHVMQGGVQVSELPRLDDDERFTVQRVSGLYYTYLGLNFGPKFDVGCLAPLCRGPEPGWGEPCKPFTTLLILRYCFSLHGW